MRDGQPGLVDLFVVVEEKVEIEGPRRVLSGDTDTAETTLDGEQDVEERTCGESRLERDDSVEEARLLADADWLRLAQGRDRHDLDPLLGAERLDGAVQRALAVTEVRAEADVRPRHGLVTVTPTVPSRSAGRTSGLRTRT